jgi:hypothetical protein
MSERRAVSNTRRLLGVVVLLLMTGLIADAYLANQASFARGVWKGAILVALSCQYTFLRLTGRRARIGLSSADPDDPAWARYSSDLLAIAAFAMGVYWCYRTNDA